MTLYLGLSTQGKSIKPFIGTNVRKDRLDRGHAMTINHLSVPAINTTFHPVRSRSLCIKGKRHGVACYVYNILVGVNCLTHSFSSFVSPYVKPVSMGSNVSISNIIALREWNPLKPMLMVKYGGAVSIS
jgi:hypothetical protein